MRTACGERVGLMTSAAVFAILRGRSSQALRRSPQSWPSTPRCPQRGFSGNPERREERRGAVADHEAWDSAYASPDLRTGNEIPCDQERLVRKEGRCDDPSRNTEASSSGCETRPTKPA